MDLEVGEACHGIRQPSISYFQHKRPHIYLQIIIDNAIMRDHDSTYITSLRVMACLKTTITAEIIRQHHKQWCLPVVSPQCVCTQYIVHTASVCVWKLCTHTD